MLDAALSPMVVAPPLERAWRATLRRNLDRPAIDKGAFVASSMSEPERRALLALMTQLEHIETKAPVNLGAIARAVPIAAVQACYTAQILDEFVHGQMLRDWLVLAQGEDESVRVHPAARWGVKLSAVVQRDPWLGTKNMAVLTELYASALLDALLEGGHVREPMLRATLASIQKDEHRHKVIALESVRAMREVGLDQRLIVRVLGGAIEDGTVFWFRTVFRSYIEKHCQALDLVHHRIIERTLDEAASA